VRRRKRKNHSRRTIRSIFTVPSDPLATVPCCSRHGRVRIDLTAYRSGRGS